jgi:tetratricopeptide (TPR) repeat protein
MTGVFVAAAVIAIPALAFTLWPLLRKDGASGLLPVPPDTREQLAEQKRAVMRTLRELEFEHGAGHISDEDYADLRARYEREAADVLSDLDRLGAAPAPRDGDVVTPRRSALLHPAALAATGVVVLVFGIAIGVGIVRYTAPDPTAGMPVPGSRPLAELSPAPGGAPGGAGAAPGGTGPPPVAGAPTGEGGPRRTLSPEMLRGMLEAARQSLFAGRIREAATAYKAVLDRDRQNVDALTHMGLILAIEAGGTQNAQLIDHALETIDKALAVDPSYSPALLYRSQILYEAKQDAAGAIKSWEKFVAVAPAGEDRDRVLKLIAEAKSRGK